MASSADNPLHVRNQLVQQRLQFWSRWLLYTLGCLIGMAVLPVWHIPVVPTLLMLAAMFCLTVIAAEMIGEWWEVAAVFVFVAVAGQVLLYGGFSTRSVFVAAWSLLLAAACLGCRELNIKRRNKRFHGRGMKGFRNQLFLLGPARPPLKDLLRQVRRFGRLRR
ncbi:MAG TPA: hypothetical protein VF272_00195 [Candidatus Saccharimonadia bacterium]